MVAHGETGDGGAHFGDDTDTFMPKDAPWRTTRHIALQDMEVGAAYRRLGNLDDGVGRRRQLRYGAVFQHFKAGSAIDKGFHGVPIVPPSAAGCTRHRR